MIELITGSPGSGKSYYAVRKVVDSILRGRVVVTNIPLVPDFAEKLAKRGWHKWSSENHIQQRQLKYESLLYVSENLEDLLRVRVEGTQEGRADMILDECQRLIDSRTWDQGVGMTKDEAILARKMLIDFFSAHRHYGYNVYLLTQDFRNIDARVQRLYEYIVFLKNLRRVKLLGIPMFPVNIFVAVRYWNDRVKTKISVSSFGLDKGIANLYSTHALREIDMPEDAIIMPRSRQSGSGSDGRPDGASAPPDVRPAPSRLSEAARPPIPPPLRSTSPPPSRRSGT